MNKVIFIVLALSVQFSFMKGLGKPSFLQSPHQAIFGWNPQKLYLPESKLPDLTKLAAATYMPFDARLKDGHFYGMLFIKNENNSVKIGGVAFPSLVYENATLLEGTLVESGDHYKVNLESKGLRDFFKAKTHFKNHIKLEMPLELRKNEKENKVYLLGQGVKFTSPNEAMVKSLVGNWEGSSSGVKVKLQLNKLPNYQLGGVVLFTADGTKCNFPVWGIPTYGKEVLLMTGEDPGQPECKPESWIASYDSGQVIIQNYSSQDYFSARLNKN